MGVRKGRINTVGDRIFAQDNATGEILGECDQDRLGAFIFMPYRERFGKEFAILFQSLLVKAALDQLQGNDLRVLLILLGTMDYNNVVTVTQAQIARELDVRPEHISKAFRKLVAGGYVHRTNGIYIISRELAWRGSAKTYNKAATGWAS